MIRSIAMAVRLRPIDREGVVQARRAAPPERLLDIVVETFEALADPTRARILYALSARSLCVRDLAAVVGVTESAVSHQLRFLRNRRIVKSRRAGTVVTYSIDTPHLKALFREAEYHADHIWHRRPNHPYGKS